MKTKSFFAVLLLMLAALVPELSWAANVTQVNPAGGNTWDMYVFGNPYIVYEILNGVRLMMMGHGTEFKTLLTALATFGFLFLAIAAGFDPGKNLMKMFFYIISVWMVSYASTSLDAKVRIMDMAGGADSHEYMVDQVPALVAVPAAFTSKVGKTMTEFIDTHFSTVSGPNFAASTGQFNLFNRMVQETNQFSIRSPELKKTLSAYSANCVIPTMAMGRLVGPSADGELTGVQALIKSTDYLETLKSAASGSLLTPYYPYDKTPPTDVPEQGTLSTEDAKSGMVNGFLMSCSSAYTLLEKDMTNYAAALVNKGAEAWTKSGVNVGFESAYTDMLGKAAAPGSTAAAFSSPNGHIMQQAFVNSLSGTFREAAMQTGNNELMQAAALSQAEAQQKSAWVAGFSMFNNMMGYVYCVLQAFIFALTPFIVIALMVPGMGKAIFVNYAQVLVWLTLWNPMLAIINFILTLYGSQEFANTLGNGLSANNSAIVAESSNNLVIAGQFLGTMVPMLTWGIVKGAMAFTEFINHGVGSSFASAAGASAATGNISMNNMGLNSTSLDKYNTQMSSAVGTQAVQAGINAGGLTANADLGGGTVKASGKDVDYGAAMQDALRSGISHSKQVAKEISAMEGENLSVGSLSSIAADNNQSSERREAAQRILAHVISGGKNSSYGEALNLVKGTSMGKDNTKTQDSGVTANAGVKGQAGLTTPIGGATIEGGMQMTEGVKDAKSEKAGESESAARTRAAELMKLVHSAMDSDSNSFTTSSGSGASQSKTVRSSSDHQAMLQRARSEALKDADSFTASAEASLSVTKSFGHARSLDVHTYQQLMDMERRAESGMESRESMEKGFKAMAGAVTGKGDAIHADFDKQKKANEEQLAKLQGGVHAHTANPVAQVPQAISTNRDNINRNNRTADVDAAKLAQRRDKRAARIEHDRTEYSPSGAVGSVYREAKDAFGGGKK